MAGPFQCATGHRERRGYTLMLIEASQLRVAPHALMFDPEFYLFDFSLQHSVTKFLLVEECTLREAPFLDIRFEPLARGSFFIGTLDLVVLERQHEVARPSSSFIFHHAFVCSTLLARCLDQIDAFFSLKEPWILRRLADTKRDRSARMPRNRWRQLFTTYMRVLAKQYESGQAPVIKATNVANNLLPDVLRYLPDDRALYLYSDLQSFLVSNLKKPPETQRKLPALAREFLQDEDFGTAFPAYSDLERLCFLQVCALTWAASLYNFLRTVDRSPGQNVRTLDTRAFLDRPQECLGSLAAFFGHPSTTEELAAMTSPKIMKKNAKQAQKEYGAEARNREACQVLEKHRRAIEDASAWIQPLVEQHDLVERMSALRLGLPTDCRLWSGRSHGHDRPARI